MSFDGIKNFLSEKNTGLYHFKSTTSTMENAKKLLEKYKSNLIVIADKQTNGKGRRGNSWLSPEGNIYCSIAICNKFSIDQHFIYSMLSLLSIKQTIKSLSLIDISFKWPNDIFFLNNKFGGIILEPNTLTNNEKFIIIGIGINFSSSPKVDHYKTTYLKKFTKIKNKFIFLKLFIKNFFYYYENYNKEKNYIFNEFQTSLMLLDKKIKINSNKDKNISGIFRGINHDGSLILDIGSKKISIYSGSIII